MRNCFILQRIDRERPQPDARPGREQSGKSPPQAAKKENVVSHGIGTHA